MPPKWMLFSAGRTSVPSKPAPVLRLGKRKFLAPEVTVSRSRWPGWKAAESLEVRMDS